MNYQLIAPLYEGDPIIHVRRLSDNSVIPLFDPGNTSYQEYLAWLAEGNTPEPADEPAAE